MLKKVGRVSATVSNNSGLDDRLGNVVVLPVFNPPPAAALSTSELVNRLDTWIRPGLTGEQFRALFAQCECGMVVSRRMFPMHECIPKKVEILDLTLDEV